MTANQEYLYDVFLSHSSNDKPAVRELAQRLRKDGLRVWFDDWEIRPGDLIGLRIERGLQQSRTLVFVMSANAFASEWAQLERLTAIFRDPTNEDRRFVPVKLDNYEVPGFLKQFAYVDWREKDEQQYAKLLSACQPLFEDSKQKSAQNYTQALTSLKGHNRSISGLAVTPDGCWAVSGSADKTVRVWNLQSNKCLETFKGLPSRVRHVGISVDGKRVIAQLTTGSVHMWTIPDKRQSAALQGFGPGTHGFSITADGHRVTTGWGNGIRVWNLDTGMPLVTLQGSGGTTQAVSTTPDAHRIISGSTSGDVHVWDALSRQLVYTLKGHTAPVRTVSITPDGQLAVSGSEDRTLRVWDVLAGNGIAALEGHTAAITDVKITTDGRTILSSSEDGSLRAWDLESGISTLVRGDGGAVVTAVALADGERAVCSYSNGTIATFTVPRVGIMHSSGDGTLEDIRYTNAKVLLVGDTGVGKSGIALRLTESRFEPTISTDAVWATQMKLPYNTQNDGVEREIWLWDFAGQADYRLIHQLFMDETALAILVFNPQSEDPFDGLAQWDRALDRAARRRFRKLLVAGRCDRGGLMVSLQAIERFRSTRGFAKYIGTSALTGEGCGELASEIVRNIDWAHIPWTSSPRIFKLLKEAILAIKDEDTVLLRIDHLKQQLQMRFPRETFTLEELRAVVGLLAGPGIVWQLEFGDFVLLQPERINSYASAVIRSVRRHTDEIGCVLEQDILSGNLDYQDMRRLPSTEEQVVLLAMHQMFVNRGLCLREKGEDGAIFIFPSYFKRERPDLETHPAPLVTYYFSGAVDEIYATLVVRLHHTTVFEKDQLWRFAADFKTQTRKRLGFKMVKGAEGSAEITVYCEPDIPDDTKVTFMRYIHNHLSAKDPDLVRQRHYICASCNMAIEARKAVQDRLARGLTDIVCAACESRVLLLDLLEQKFLSDDMDRVTRDMEEKALSRISNESQELSLLGEVMTTAVQAGHVFRSTLARDQGLDAEIEFKDHSGKMTGSYVYLQIRTAELYSARQRRDGTLTLKIVNLKHSSAWRKLQCPLLLIIRTADGVIRWMDVRAYLNEQEEKLRQAARDESSGREEVVQHIVFDGEPFTAASLQTLWSNLNTSYEGLENHGSIWG